jgi:hypothetical protein
MAFKKMENIGNYCDAVKGYGIREEYCFQTVDLYEGKNMRQVLINLSNVYAKVSARGKRALARFNRVFYQPNRHFVQGRRQDFEGGRFLQHPGFSRSI